jgi:hypothetical protein
MSRHCLACSRVYAYYDAHTRTQKHQRNIVILAVKHEENKREIAKLKLKYNVMLEDQKASIESNLRNSSRILIGFFMRNKFHRYVRRITQEHVPYLCEYMSKSIFIPQIHDIIMSYI